MDAGRLHAAMRHGALGGGVIAKLGLEGEGLPAGGAHGVHGLVRGRRVARVVDAHAGPQPAEQDAHRAADAAAAAGHQRASPPQGQHPGRLRRPRAGGQRLLE